MENEIKKLVSIYKVQQEEVGLQPPEDHTDLLNQITESMRSRENGNAQRLSEQARKKELIEIGSPNGSAASVSPPIDLITPQEALPMDFFDLPLVNSSTSSSLAPMIAAGSVDNDSCGDIFSTEFKKVVLTGKQLELTEDASARELETFLESSVCDLPAVNSTFVNRFVNIIPLIFDPSNVELCMNAAFGIFPVFIANKMLMRLLTGDPLTQFNSLKVFITFFKPYLLKVTNVFVWSQFNFVGVNSVQAVIINTLGKLSYNSGQQIPLAPFYSSRLVGNIAARTQIVQESILALKTKPFFNKVVVLRIVTFTLTVVVLPLMFPMVRKFASDQVFLLINKEKIASMVVPVVVHVIKEVITKKNVDEVLDKVFEVARDHPSNPLAEGGIPSTLIKFIYNIGKNYDLGKFDVRLDTVVDILATFFN